jgi:phage anti-repressor protein
LSQILSKDETGININQEERQKIDKVIQEGGRIWEILYKANEIDIKTVLSKELSTDELKLWENLKFEEKSPNDLWSTLSSIQQVEENQKFQNLKDKLQEAEKTLQRKQKSNEVILGQNLYWRKINALWIPVFDVIARLKFSKEEVEKFSTSGESLQRFRETLTSWKGFRALFCIGLFLVIILNPDGRAQISQAFHMLLTATPIQELIQSSPEWIRRISTYIQIFINWVKLDLNPWFKIIPVLLLSLKALTTYINSVQKEQSRIQGEKDILLKQAQQKTEPEAQNVAQLRLQVEEERRRLGLNVQYPSLLDFVNARLSGNDYGKHLGLMQQVKQDLVVLSSRLTVGKHNHHDLKKLFPRGPARIVLFIDDLDRCPPDRVVEVLEAIQLLLNTELFVVVLAIDDRYIARALEQVYQGVLKRRGKPSGIDYLEKIIQIPYRMRPISSDTIEDYFRSQLNIKETETESISDKDHTYSFSTEMPVLNVEYSRTNLPNEVSKEAEINTSISNSNLDSKSSHSLPDITNPSTHNTSKTPIDSLDELHGFMPVSSQIENLQVKKLGIEQQQQTLDIETNATFEEFSDRELKLLVDCCKHVDITPRTGKRLINTYKILLIIWRTRNKKVESQGLPTDQEKRVVMSFLALSGRYPEFMRSLFEEIDFFFKEASYELGNQEKGKNSKISEPLDMIMRRVEARFNHLDLKNSRAKREWERFAFDIEHMLKEPIQCSNDSVNLEMDRRTFLLMLSFCFVGDLGYDPDDLNI